MVGALAAARRGLAAIGTNADAGAAFAADGVVALVAVTLAPATTHCTSARTSIRLLSRKFP